MKLSMKFSALLLSLVALPFASAFAAPTACTVKLSQDPLVMRVGKDEFRIAFGLSADACASVGCSGTIHYQAAWKTEDGTARIEPKTVSFTIPQGAQRSISVDRHYFDTAEAQHETQVDKILVEQISVDQTHCASPTGLAQR